jgi:Domain of unknown function (DUF4249)
MKRRFTIGHLTIIIICTDFACIKNYSPEATTINYRYLVVNGQIINSADSPTVITLSRTVMLSDSNFNALPETGAVVSVQSSSGESFPLVETASGVYQSVPLLLDYSKQYRINIRTKNGENYFSDYVPVVQTPAIDSITWQQDNDVIIYANTHGSVTDTRYYRWDYTETWQYTAPYNRTIADTNGILYYVDSTTQTFNCWRSDQSTNIVVASTAALSNNVVAEQPLTTILQNDEKMSVRYSILVKQYGLTQDAYQYLSVLQKNTEALGSIFDAQPTQLAGNIHCASNPGETVLGYISACSVSQHRIFIDINQLQNWNYVYNGEDCGLKHIPQNSTNFLIYTYPDTSYAPYYFISSPPGIELAKRPCVDCTTQGGTTLKPSYW